MGLALGPCLRRAEPLDRTGTPTLKPGAPICRTVVEPHCPLLRIQEAEANHRPASSSLQAGPGREMEASLPRLVVRSGWRSRKTLLCAPWSEESE